MISVPLIVLACILIALGRLQIRRARRAERPGILRRLGGWCVLALGFVLMILGVLLWGNALR
jgi:uncharacterized membrane protein YidH (DUF202 family)